MPQYRRDPVRGGWVIIATERAKRPEDFTKGKTESLPVAKTDKECFFCPGHEAETPAEVLVYGHKDRQPNSPGWLIVLTKKPGLTPRKLLTSRCRFICVMLLPT